MPRGDVDDARLDAAGDGGKGIAQLIEPGDGGTRRGTTEAGGVDGERRGVERAGTFNCGRDAETRRRRWQQRRSVCPTDGASWDSCWNSPVKSIVFGDRRGRSAVVTPASAGRRRHDCDTHGTRRCAVVDARLSSPRELVIGTRSLEPLSTSVTDSASSNATRRDSSCQSHVATLRLQREISN